MKTVAFFKKLFRKTESAPQIESSAPQNENPAPQNFSYVSHLSEEDMIKESEKHAELERKIAEGKIEVHTTGPEPFDFDYDGKSM